MTLFRNLHLFKYLALVTPGLRAEHLVDKILL